MLLIIWRYLLTHYFKILFLSTITFISILLITRLEDVARFAALGAPFSSVLLFTVHQIPYIIPVALPISSLIATLILYKKLSHTNELIALRAAGIGLSHVTLPVIIASFFLIAVNFYIVSELATNSHLNLRRMRNELLSINPLSLLQNPQLLQLKGAHIDIRGSQQPGESVEDIVFAINNPHHESMRIIAAKRIEKQSPSIHGDMISLISFVSNDSSSPDTVVVENIKSCENSSNDFSRFMKTKGWDLREDLLSLRQLHMQIRNELSTPLTKNSWYRISQILLEISRRFSVALATFTFTLMGAAFGIDIGRSPNKFKVYSVILLAALYLILFFTAKGMEHHFVLPLLLYFVPHLIIAFLSFRTLLRINRGVE